MKPRKNSIFSLMKDTLSRLATEYWKLSREIRARKEAETALANSEDKFRIVFESANVGKSITRPTGEIEVNQAFCDMLGYTLKELKSKKWQDITPPDEFETTQNVIDQLLQGKKDSIRFNKRYIRKNGSYIWTDVSTVVHRDINCKPLFFITTVTDTTEHKRASDALEESELRLRTFLDASSDMAFLKDDSYRHLTVNSSLCKFYGKTESEIIGKTDFDLMTEKDAVQCRKTDEQTLLSNALLITEEVVGGRCYETMKFPVKLVEGKMGIGAYIRDITERKRMESERETTIEALRESEQRYRSLVENANETIFVAQDDMIKFVNHAGVEMAGYPEEEIISKPFIEFVHPDDRRKVKERYQKRLCGEELEPRFTFRLITRDGNIRWLELGATMINYEGRSATLNIVTDITERKRMEEEAQRLNIALEKKVAERTRELQDSQWALLNLVDDLNQSSKNLFDTNQALEAVNHELSAFSYSVSHDLRAPLRSIDGFSQALLEDCWDKLDDEGKKYLERVRQATQNMGRLIDDMLNLSRVTQSEFCREPVDLSKMVHAIADTNQQNNALNVLTLNIQEGIIIRGDQRLMNIALTNLLDNAWKFAGKQEHPRIEFGAVVKDSERIIFVRDNGVGFDMTYAGKLFGTFQRLHRADEFPGTGIGLAIVLRVINRHGGKVWAESEVGKGATFFFTLPE